MKLGICQSKSSLVCIFLATGSCLISPNSCALPLTQGDAGLLNDLNVAAVTQYVLPALRQAGKAGRLYYASTCRAEKEFSISFPKLNLRMPPEGSSGLAAVREIFRNEATVDVSEVPAGVIRITIGEVPTSILRTFVSHITFKPLEQFNPSMAIFAIEGSDDVLGAMNRSGVRAEAEYFNLLMTSPSDGAPHLSDSLSNLTMDQALDRVAQTFEGIVFYGACSNAGFYRVNFARG